MAAPRHGRRHARNRGFTLSAMLLAVATAIALLVVAPRVAQAAAGPVTSATWTDNISERVSPQDAGPNGAVLYLNPPSTYFPIRGISPTGGTLWTSPPALPGFVLAQPVTDAAGNTYEIDQVDVGEAPGTPGRTDVVARNGSTVLWDVTPDSTYELFRIAVGNGRVYAVGVVPNTLNYALFTLDASTGATVARTDAVNGEMIDQVFAYNGGVAALVNNGTSDEIRYYSADGQAGPAYAVPAGYGITSYAGESQVNANGTVYLTSLSDSQSCTQPSVEIIKPVGGLSGPFTLGGPCISGYSPLTSTVTPHGLAVITADQRITLVGPDGTVTPPSALPATSGQGSSVAAIHSNTDGNVLVAQQASNISCAAAPNLGCTGLQFDLVDPATGNLVAPIALQQPSGNAVDYLMFRPEQGMAFDGTRLYATVNIGTTTNYSGTDDLEAFDGPNLGLEYPESQLQGAGTSPSPSPTPTPTTTPPVSSHYVALGDSYSAGEGTGDYLPGTNDPSLFDTCHRSPHAYGPLLDTARQLGSMVFAACSGAVTDDMYVANASNPNEPPQFSQLSPSTTLVTLTIGGNDADFVHILTKCIDGFDPGAPPQDQGSWGCSEKRALRQDISDRLALLSGQSISRIIIGRTIHSLSDVYQRIHAAAPNAQIYVGGYPRLFGSDPSSYRPTLAAPSGRVCIVARGPTGLRFSVDFRDALWLDGLADRLDSVIQQQVKAASALGLPVHYVKPSFATHGLCDTGTPWFNPLIIVKRQPSSGSFHPTAVGQARGYEVPFSKAMP